MIKIKVKKFEKGKSIFDDYYGDIIRETPSKLDFIADGYDCNVSEINASKEALIKKAVERTAWNEWFYKQGGEMKTFSEIGLEPPIIEWREDIEKVTIVGDFVNNCRGLMPISHYEEILVQLKEIALKEIEIEMIDGN